MNRDQLDHVLRAATDVIERADIVVVGSQSVLAVAGDALPIEATRSIEVDLAFIDDVEDAKADRIDGAIGELSQFHRSFGYYGQGVSLTTPVLPNGWLERLIELDPPRPGSHVRALEPHDCTISKLVAWRPKDLEFAEALLNVGLVDAATLRARVALLPEAVSAAQRRRIVEFLDCMTQA